MCFCYELVIMSKQSVMTYPACVAVITRPFRPTNTD